MVSQLQGHASELITDKNQSNRVLLSKNAPTHPVSQPPIHPYTIQVQVRLANLILPIHIGRQLAHPLPQQRPQIKILPRLRHHRKLHLAPPLHILHRVHQLLDREPPPQNIVVRHPQLLH
ncbi:MAG: hypothetical protein FRX48_06953 [Lasallia pustulata]|uniref:Uncharacterized protein n=1 Tax=Lasallia pustulata TaxID=136370 RepID=A0A5M8PK50_9LECA|nr:MAG: hypothetical protein FRX48_06953 [Lasallia pustulata]